ncbi:putative NRPS-like protein biosynthetic cluster [Aspergillus viridinutans]|uniref:NRPS-like protein biosynthetic cluster n=1 Tax=Aspergillus viridinutans TaxID=75553 RepID=A0A9P3C4K3_ASPVI|nr:putative NRPS-like protein biosynthetic cluster [Aspergillus viridinutans]GIK05076.1 putative NRPS-like protein biosynthetic cluster [Aspergillus viridinutans]
MAPSELRGPPLPDSDATLHEVFYQNVVKYPDTVALVSTQQAAVLYGIPSLSIDTAKREADYLRWTYRDLDRAIQRLVTGLQSRGLKRGDALVISMPNIAEYVIATWAAYQIGCTYVPINPKGLSNAREMRHMLQTAIKGCQSDFLGIIAGTSDICVRIDELTSELNCMRILVEGEMDGWTPFKELMQNPAPDSQQSLCRGHYSKLSDRTIFFTSGTTSLPKGCIMPSAYGFAAALCWRQSSVPMLPGDRVLFTLPNNHGFGWLCIISSFLNAATAVLPGPRFIPEAVIKAIREERVSHAGLVPTMLHALSNVPIASRKLNSLRRIVMGGSPPTEEVIRICLDTLGASGVENLYGMTEGILVSSGVVSQASDIIKGRIVSIGTPLPGMTVRIYAKDSKVPTVAGEAGEIHFSGPSLINGYIGGADGNFYNGEDGRPWFRTGDKAFIGGDDRLYLIGRYKDTIIRGGENIEPQAIEAVLGQIPEINILQPQIVRAPDNIAGEVPIVVVNQEVDDCTARRLKDTVLTQMGNLYVPADVIPIQALGYERYPDTMAGKVQKAKLEDLVRTYWEHQHTQGSHSIDGPISGPQVTQSLCMAIEKEQGHPIDPFLRMIELGVDSILSIAILKRVQAETGVSLPSSLFFTQATVGAICQQISSISDPADFLNFAPVMEDAPSNPCFSVLLQGTPRAGIPSLFLTPPGSGNAFVYRTLPKFANDCAVYSFGSPFLMTKSESSWTIEDTAAIYANTIRSIDPQGPYILCGWSMGTATAYETAYQLHEQGKQVLGIIMLDLALPRPPPKIPEATVELFEMMGVFPPIRREGKPDVEIPAFRKKHRVAAYYAKMKYVPRPFNTSGNASRPQIFVIWAGHGDHDRMAAMVLEAMDLLKKEGPGTKMKISDDWLHLPRESFDAGGWDEMVGPENVEWGVVEDADHDTLIESEGLVVLTKGLMEEVMDKWLREMEVKQPNSSG